MLLNALGPLLAAVGALLAALDALLAALGTLLGRSKDTLGLIWGPRRVDLGLSEESPRLLQEDSEQLKRTNANIPNVDRKLSENHPRGFRKPNPAALYSQLPPTSIAKMMGAGGLRAAN